jgi:o-succinylbenzoate synthase
MRIDQIEIRCLEIPLVHPFETSFGREDARQTIVVAVRGGGLTGWGEAATSAGPWYEYETVETCWHVLHDFLAPAVVGQEVSGTRDAARLMAPARGHHLAKMGLEAAVWDLLGQVEARSISEMLGGIRDRVSVGVSIGVQASVPELLERVAAFWLQCYSRVKVKIRPGWDVDVLRQLRREFPGVPLMADANSA